MNDILVIRIDSTHKSNLKVTMSQVASYRVWAWPNVSQSQEKLQMKMVQSKPYPVHQLNCSPCSTPPPLPPLTSVVDPVLRSLALFASNRHVNEATTTQGARSTTAAAMAQRQCAQVCVCVFLYAIKFYCSERQTRSARTLRTQRLPR